MRVLCRELNMTPCEVDAADVQDVADWMTLLNYEAEMAKANQPRG